MWIYEQADWPHTPSLASGKIWVRYRLFSRFDSATKIIIYCWINDEETLRARGSKRDPYTVFTKMLESGSPPSTWDELLEDSVPLA
jgi:toxin YhaV